MGCGSGSYGLLFRDILDRMRSRYTPDEWAVRIDAVDIWREYFTPVHDYVYDNCEVFDVRKTVDGDWPAKLLDVYDVVFMGDVIEHLDKDEGVEVLAALKHHAKLLLISTPITPYKQGAYKRNIHEAHISKWSPEDFRLYGFEVLFHKEGNLLLTAAWHA